MIKTLHTIVSFVSFILGILFLLNAKLDITGAVIGISTLSSLYSSLFGIILVLFSALLFVSGRSLEERVDELHHWKLYKLSPIHQAEDVEKGYLKRKKQASVLTPLQERIERMITGGTIIKKPYQEHTYEEQFYSGHASQGGRIIDVDSHVAHKRKYAGKFFDKIPRWWHRGRLEHFNQSANGWYIWVVDEKGNFVIGNRETFESLRHGHKLPHPVLAKGEKVFGSGEVFIQKESRLEGSSWRRNIHNKTRCSRRFTPLLILFTQNF